MQSDAHTKSLTANNAPSKANQKIMILTNSICNQLNIKGGTTLKEITMLICLKKQSKKYKLFHQLKLLKREICSIFN